MNSMSVVDEYIRRVAEPNKSELSRLQSLVTSLVPDAVEVITYGLPGFKYKGKYLVAFGAYKDHLSIFPAAHAIEANKSQLNNFKLSKGTVQYTLDNPISDTLITQLVHVRMHDIDSEL